MKKYAVPLVALAVIIIVLGYIFWPDVPLTATEKSLLRRIDALESAFADLETLDPIALRNLAHSDLYKAVGPRVARVQQEPTEEPVAPDTKPAKGDKE